MWDEKNKRVSVRHFHYSEEGQKAFETFCRAELNDYEICEVGS